MRHSLLVVILLISVEYLFSQPCVVSGHSSTSYTSPTLGTVSADFSWNLIVEADEYRVIYTHPGIGDQYGSPTTNNTVTINNLEPNTDYQWRVAVKCSGTWNYPSWQGSFTTPDGDVCESTGHSSNVYLDGSNLVVADLNWDELGIAQEYRVIYTHAGINDQYGSPTTSTTSSLSGLEPNTNYDWRVAVKCGGSWTYPAWQGSFTTPNGAACEATGHSSSVGIDGSTGTILADLDWNDLGIAQEYRVIYTHAGIGDQYSSPIAGSSYTIVNLEPNTVYDWRVAVNCGGTWNYPGWQGTFTTPDGETCEVDGHSSSAYLNPVNGTVSADLSWNPLSIAEEYRVIYTHSGIGDQYAPPTSSAVQTIVNLEPNTDYDWRIAVKCGDMWSYPGWQGSFTTPDGATCKVFGHSAEVVKDEFDNYSVALSWDALSFAEEYRVIYTHSGIGDQYLASTTLTNATINNLDTDTEYEWRVAVKCNGDWSYPGWEGTFNTSPRPFITTWKTDNPGYTADNQVKITTLGSGYDYTVDWHEVGNPANSGSSGPFTGNAIIDFPIEGIYQLEITGLFPRIYFPQLPGGFGSKPHDWRKLLSVEQWGDNQWVSMKNAFSSCSNLVINASDIPDLSLVTDMSNMFLECSSMNQDINSWNVQNVTNMSGMFKEATSFNQPLNLWIVDAVNNMANMFHKASSFNQDIGGWNVSNVTDMSYMFFVASDFNQDIGGWNVSSVNNMNLMFGSAYSFNQDIGNWIVSNVTNMNSMFAGASTFNQNISNWEVDNVTNMSSLFALASAFNQDIGGWNVHKVESMFAMFDRATSFNQDLGSWDISSVVNLSVMFDESNLSKQNYESTLLGWSTLGAGETQIPTNLTLGADDLTYCDDTGRNALINTYGWTIFDDGQDCPPPPIAARTGEEEVVTSADGTQISMNMYPNPADEWFTIKGNYLINGTIQIIDLNGKVLRSVEGIPSETVTIDIYDIQDGIYLLKVEASDFVYERKLVIKH